MTAELKVLYIFGKEVRAGDLITDDMLLAFRHTYESEQRLRVESVESFKAYADLAHRANFEREVTKKSVVEVARKAGRWMFGAGFIFGTILTLVTTLVLKIIGVLV